MPNNLPTPLPEVILAMILSTVIAILRVIYDQEETKATRIVLESVICGGLTFTVSYAITAMSFSADWAVFAGGCIGFMGSQYLRVIAKKALTKRIDK